MLRGRIGFHFKSLLLALLCSTTTLLTFQNRNAVVSAVLETDDAATVDESDLVDVWISGGDGIYRLQLDQSEGVMSAPKRVAEFKGSGFLALHPTLPVVYSTESREQPGVAGYLIGDDPQSQLLNLGFASTGDGGAACVGVDRSGRMLMSAQYGSGTVTTYQLKLNGEVAQAVETVKQGPGSQAYRDRQNSAHPHWVGTTPDNRFMVVPDLGMDRVVVYQLEMADGKPTGKLKPHREVAVPPGSGPRHMKFHPNGKYAYVLNELTLAVSVFGFAAEDAEFEEVQVVESLPENLRDDLLNSAAEIRVHPNGNFLYASNRGHDTITVFAIDRDTGKLSFVQREPIRGSWPRNFNIAPNGQWLIAAGRYTNTLSLFKLDPDTGRLTFTRKAVNVPAPICVEFGQPR